jgi:hypothetical protein
MLAIGQADRVGRTGLDRRRSHVEKVQIRADCRDYRLVRYERGSYGPRSARLIRARYEPASSRRPDGARSRVRYEPGSSLAGRPVPSTTTARICQPTAGRSRRKLAHACVGRSGVPRPAAGQRHKPTPSRTLLVCGRRGRYGSDRGPVGPAAILRPSSNPAGPSPAAKENDDRCRGRRRVRPVRRTSTSSQPQRRTSGDARGQSIQVPNQWVGTFFVAAGGSVHVAGWRP